MEYVDAPPMDSGVVGKWEEKHRADLVCHVLFQSDPRCHIDAVNSNR